MTDIPSVLSLTPGTVNTENFLPLTTYNIEGGAAPVLGLGAPVILLLIVGLLLTCVTSSMALLQPASISSACCILINVIITAVIVYFLQKNAVSLAWAIVAFNVVCMLSACVSIVSSMVSMMAPRNPSSNSFSNTNQSTSFYEDSPYPISQEDTPSPYPVSEETPYSPEEES
jgi:hypothetical protein